MNEIAKPDLPEAIARVLVHQGINLLNSPNQFLSVLMDACDNDSVDMIILSRNCDRELLAPFKTACEKRTPDALNQASVAVYQLLTEDRRIDAYDARNLCESLTSGFATYLGIRNEGSRGNVGEPPLARRDNTLDVSSFEQENRAAPSYPGAQSMTPQNSYLMTGWAVGDSPVVDSRSADAAQAVSQAPASVGESMQSVAKPHGMSRRSKAVIISAVVAILAATVIFIAREIPRVGSVLDEYYGMDLSHIYDDGDPFDTISSEGDGSETVHFYLKESGESLDFHKDVGDTILVPDGGILLDPELTFLGWVDEENGVTYQEGDEYVVEGPASLYAEWDYIPAGKYTGVVEGKYGTWDGGVYTSETLGFVITPDDTKDYYASFMTEDYDENLLLPVFDESDWAETLREDGSLSHDFLYMAVDGGTGTMVGMYEYEEEDWGEDLEPEDFVDTAFEPVEFCGRTWMMGSTYEEYGDGELEITTTYYAMRVDGALVMLEFTDEFSSDQFAAVGEYGSIFMSHFSALE